MYLENRKFVRKRNVMDIQTRKYNLIQELFSIEKESVIEELESIVNGRKKDWWNELSKQERQEIEEGIKEADAGQLINHQKVMNRFDKWK